MSNKSLEVKLLNEHAKPPVRATTEAAGFDLCGVSCSRNTAGVDVISTGVAMQIPHGYMGIIKARSSYAFRHGMVILAGVIDSDYRDEIKVLFRANDDFEFQPGERCAQIIIIPNDSFNVEIVDDFTREAKDRTGGFGSTDRVAIA